METTKVLLWSDQDGDEQLSNDDGPDSEREEQNAKMKEGTATRNEWITKERGKWRIEHGDKKAYTAQVTVQTFVLTDDEVELLRRAMHAAI